MIKILLVILLTILVVIVIKNPTEDTVIDAAIGVTI